MQNVGRQSLGETQGANESFYNLSTWLKLTLHTIYIPEAVEDFVCKSAECGQTELWDSQSKTSIAAGATLQHSDTATHQPDVN